MLILGTGKERAAEGPERQQSSPLTLTRAPAESHLVFWLQSLPKELAHTEGGIFLGCQMHLLPISLKWVSKPNPHLALLSPVHYLYLFQFPSAPFWVVFWFHPLLSTSCCRWSPSIFPLPNHTTTVDLIKFKVLIYLTHQMFFQVSTSYHGQACKSQTDLPLYSTHM